MSSFFERLLRAFTLKYFKKIDHASPDPAADFDLGPWRREGWLHNARSRIIDRITLAVLWLAREIWPNPQIGRLLIVTRASDVEQVLADNEHFVVPFGPEMAALAGANSVLGLDGAEHKRLNGIIRNVLRPGDMEQILLATQRVTRNLIATSGGRIDVMRDVITRVSTETCSDYFGLNIEDHDAFAEWSMAMSMLLFADPFGSDRTRRTALAGGARMRQVIHRAINRARAHPDDRTIVGRLVQVQAEQRNAGQRLSDDDVCGLLMSLVTGFIPTNTLAAGNILQELLRRPDRLDEAKALALHGERDRLRAVLLEAARFNPALSPGQWRYALKEQTIAADTSRSKRVREGTVLLVATKSALRDRRAVAEPSAFRTDRKLDPDWMFGFGPHKCLGAHIATEHILEIFSVVLAQPNLQRVTGKHGRFAFAGPFPERLDVEFGEAPSAIPQSMLTICAPLKADASRKEVERLVLALNDSADMKRALDDTGIVHFASLNVIEAGSAAEPHPHLLLELNVDGPPEAAIAKVAHCAEAQLKPVFAHAQAEGASLADTFAACALDLKTRAWGATGLNFNGTPEFPVAEIAVQQSLATFARRAVTCFIGIRSGIGSRALPAARFVRRLIRQDQSCLDETSDPAAKQEISRLLDEGAQFRDYLVLPGRKRLQISEWVERTNEDAIYRFLRSRDFWVPASGLIVVAALMGIAIYAAVDLSGRFSLPGQILLSFTGGVISAAILALAVAAAFIFVLRWYERSDVPDDREADLSALRAATARENLPGYAQNHFIAVTPLKPGWFRKLTLALSLWGIKQLVKHAYRPGFVLNMGTIHYAKWFRLPKTDKLVFLSNYDGSWESYLEDFIMKAHAGQTAAWSNGVGFPKTRLLIYEGAQDGDRFKRWVRRQQVPSQFWYSRFPDLTTDQIRNNAVIHQGLARANTDTEAMSWLACFGSMQRPDHAIETDEIQSLMFRGFKHSPFAGYALVKLPEAAARRRAWLEALLPGKLRQDGSRDVDVAQSERKPEARSEATSQAGHELTKLTFGDHPTRENQQVRGLATFVAFSAHGLRTLGLPCDNGDGTLAGFASAFNIGMANRARVLGDRHDPPEAWRWSDAPRTDENGHRLAGTPAADAILIVFGKSPDQCEAALQAHRATLGDDAFIGEIRCEPVDRSTFREHFGFRDGMSQPVIRGTQRLVEGEGAIARDIVEPGEFILGYRNNQGYYPPAITVSAATDFNDRLPDVIADTPPRFPSFQTGHNNERDFGRNGTYLVVRQMQQHVDRFNKFTENAATELARNASRQAAGVKIDAKWVAAKMMGRWQDGGEPLVLRPVASAPRGLSDKAANDFAYAEEDAQGLRCPFGAHIRRANPRDGLRPGDNLQQAITNRHRLLRRGRTYGPPATEGSDSDAERGIVFTCLCADLERQFEFVQQTWIGSSSFHGLSGEVDPMIGSHDPNTKGVFTIPTPSGPITLEDLQNFVTVRAGGYFFMPSYSALVYLLDVNAAAAR